jgi:hypothetical protein
MDCERFRELNRIYGVSPLDREVWETSECSEWNEHLSNCTDCHDWRMALEVVRRGAKVEDFPCVHMAFHATFQCEDHPELNRCSTATILYNERFDEYAIGSRGGPGDNFGISNCPWCGVKLPDSRRDDWFDTLEKLGIDPVRQDIPIEFQTSKWRTG